MKRITATVCSILIVASVMGTVSAQDEPATGPWEFGGKLGVSFGGFWGQGIQEFEDNLAGTVAGVDEQALIFVTGDIFAAYHIIPDLVALQLELQAVRTGKVWHVDLIGGGDADFKVSTDYIRVPILAKAMLPLDMPVMPFAFAGPSFSFKVAARTDDLDDVPQEVDLGFLRGFPGDADDLVNDTEFGLVVGIGAGIPDIGPGDVIVDVRYAIGLPDVFDVEAATDVRNSFYKVMAGYSIRPW